MTDPKRWLFEGDAPKSARRLLQAIEIPKPPSASKQGELVQKLATLAAGPALAPVAAMGGSWMKLALVCGGVAGSVALLLAAFQVFSTARDTAANEPPKLAASELASRLVVAPLLPPPELRAAATTPVAGGGDTAKPPAASTLPSRPIQRSNPDALAAEEALLERARGFASSAPARAWELLERHRSRFPQGQLVAERLSLSVDVLQRLGKTPAAQAQAETLLRQFPGSVYAVQLRQRHGMSQAAHPRL
jgi:hypothetical protein